MFLFLIPAYLESRQIVISFKTIPRSSYSQTNCGNSDLNSVFFFFFTEHMAVYTRKLINILSTTAIRIVLQDLKGSL